MEVRSPESGDGGLRVVRVDYGHPDALALIEQVQEEYVARYGGRDESPVEPAMFVPPTGSFFVGYVGDDPVATGAWRRSGVEALGTVRTAEVKRMYVVPAAQRRGHARRMLAHLEQTAAAAGFEALVLETGLRQPEAMALYESAGYASVPGFGYYKDAPLSRCYAKVLTPA
ncbi:GNAT family N-acetyltransferase [Nocardioides sp. SOB77]|uniref:GNAT family N-acetyltransferase n=1 Tax=Nocardioides oceani TaxID=3058369 RepID=A0ABT8FB23_9ACTN|nr:GNAT family N-acetyltransferase [Nocardioides oceani]MDN4171630.1 GNAT family N-acetyltransferase [Nocardioides oceani]